MITPAYYDLRYHKLQSELWRTKARYVAVSAGRGSGKTELARRRIVRFLPITKDWLDPIYFYALPTFAQAKRVAWKPLKRLIPKDWIKKANETELIIETVFGSTLYVFGMDKPQRAEGVQWDGGVIDESSDQRPGIFDRSFLPSFSHRNAWCWRIGVPKRYGCGAREFKQACDDWRNVNDLDTASFTWPSEEILTPEQIAWARENLDPRDYNEQYNANWEEAGGLIFYAFDKENISTDAEYVPLLPIVVGSDFNVNPMCWVIGHIIKDELHIFDELFVRNTNTQKTLDELHRRYGKHEAGWQFYGDATGRARKTSASISDFVQIRNDRRFHSARVYYPKSNPLVIDRFAACNAMFKNASGVRRCKINPRCKRVVQDIEERVYKEGTREPDDYGDVGHMTDALGYIIHRKFPVRIVQSGVTPKVFMK